MHATHSLSDLRWLTLLSFAVSYSSISLFHVLNLIVYMMRPNDYITNRCIKRSFLRWISLHSISFFTSGLHEKQSLVWWDCLSNLPRHFSFIKNLRWQISLYCFCIVLPLCAVHEHTQYILWIYYIARHCKYSTSWMYMLKKKTSYGCFWKN